MEMDNMGKEYKNILNNLEEKLKDNPDLEYVKSEFSNLFMLFFNEIDSLRNIYEEKIQTILDRQSYFDEKINKIEAITNDLEKEFLCDDTDDFEFRDIISSGIPRIEEFEEENCELNCPYCNETFFINLEKAEEELTCPYCDNLIELDWNDSSDDSDNTKK